MVDISWKSEVKEGEWLDSLCNRLCTVRRDTYQEFGIIKGLQKKDGRRASVADEIPFASFIDHL